jgi:hypothetical protein
MTWREPRQLSVDEMRSIADALFAVTWSDDANGFLQCPGQEHHTKGDGSRDCKISLAGGKPPTIYCFHASCVTEVDAACHKLRSALGTAAVTDPEDEWRPANDWKPLPPVKPPEPKPTFRNDKLTEFAARWRQFVDTAWLADRSPVATFNVTPAAFLEQLYRPGEHVVVFTSQQSQGQCLWPNGAIPDGSEDGVWFLCQPVDGKTYPNPRNLDKITKEPIASRRSEESVTSWRYLVIESDEANARDWMGALVQLPLAIAAIYTSGGRSIHALVRVNAPSKHEWDSIARAMKPILVTLGADPKSLSAVRLTRLPGCRRRDQMQKLLYLNPDPRPKPICTLERRRDCIGALTKMASAWLVESNVEVIVNAGASNLGEVIAALDEHETVKQGGVPANCLRALEWLRSSPAAAELLEKVRSVSKSAVA